MQNSQRNVIDINNEFSLLIDLIGRLWDGCDSESAQAALKLSFQQGLEDGKLWIDPYSTIRISEALNGNDEICCPLEKRSEFTLDGDDSAILFDALYMFDSALSHGITKIYNSVTGGGRWRYSDNADALVSSLTSQFPDIAVTPKDQDHQSQKAMADAYAGLHANEAGSYPTPERLLKRYVEYSRDDQGLSFIRSLFSTVYSHGLYCAKALNTETLILDLLPIYEKRDEPLNFDNGDEILSVALNNPFVAIINKMKPFSFSSTSKYMASNQKRADHALTQETEAEKQSRMDAMLDRMMKGMDDKIKKDEMRVNALIDEIKQTFVGFKLA